MALPVARDSVVCNISFDGLLDKNSKATLFNELIKYILFEKNQMPEMFDQLKRNTHVRGKVSQISITFSRVKNVFVCL